MGFTPVHQRRCSTGLPSTEAESQPGSAYTLSGITGHVEGVPPPSPTLTSRSHNWYYEK